MRDAVARLASRGRSSGIVSWLLGTRGVPEHIRSDKGPEFRATVGRRIDRVEKLAACFGSNAGVVPSTTPCFGPRTERAGLTSTTWCVVSQSKSMRIPARMHASAFGAPRCLRATANGLRHGGLVPRSRPCAKPCFIWVHEARRLASRLLPGRYGEKTAVVKPAKERNRDPTRAGDYEMLLGFAKRLAGWQARPSPVPPRKSVGQATQPCYSSCEVFISDSIPMIAWA